MDGHFYVISSFKKLIFLLWKWFTFTVENLENIDKEKRSIEILSSRDSHYWHFDGFVLHVVRADTHTGIHTDPFQMIKQSQNSHQMF